MSLIEKYEKLQYKAANGEEIEVLKAALAESQAKYNKQANKILDALIEMEGRLSKLEKAVNQSNENTKVDIHRALENSISRELIPVIETTQVQLAPLLKKLEETEEKVGGMTWTAMVGNGIVVLFVFLLGVFVYWLIGRLDSLDAINNGIYQLLQVNGLI